MSDAGAHGLPAPRLDNGYPTGRTWNLDQLLVGRADGTHSMA